MIYNKICNKLTFPTVKRDALKEKRVSLRNENPGKNNVYLKMYFVIFGTCMNVVYINLD